MGILIIVGVVLVGVGIIMMIIRLKPNQNSKDNNAATVHTPMFIVSGPAGLAVIVIGVVCVIVGATQHRNNSSIPITSNSTEPTGATTAPSPTPDASPLTPTITIIKPSSGSYVNLNDDVQVQLSNVSTSRDVWLLVQLGSQVYPQGPCNDVSLTVTDCPNVRFGDPGMQYGTPYKLTAVLVSTQDNNKYQPYYTSGFSAQSPPVSPILSSSSITVYGRE
jgi:hypothetical protein